MAKTTTNKINLLLLLALCLGYGSTLYAMQHDVDDEKEAYHADNDAYNKAQHSQSLIIKRPTTDFQPLPKKRPERGSSMDIQYFRDKKSGKIWIGKCNINAFIGASNDDEYRAALGLAIYRFFGIITPDFAVSVQPVAPSVYKHLPQSMDNSAVYRIDKKRGCTHIMTQFLEGFSTCEDAFKEDAQDDQKAAAITDHASPFMRAYKRAAKAKKPFFLEKNGKKYPLQGLGGMLAVAHFIYDINCIGKSGDNLGYLIDDKDRNAQVVKIKAGKAFSFLDGRTNKQFYHNPMDRNTFFSTHESAPLGYAQLTPVDQQDFAAMAKRILQTPQATLKQLIEGVMVADGWHPAKAKKLLAHLIERRSVFFASLFRKIDNNHHKETIEAKQLLVASLAHQQGTQKQSKEQIEAYLKALERHRALEAKAAASSLIKQKKHQNNQTQKPVVKEIFQLPARGNHFTGREKEQTSIVAFFRGKREKPCAFQAITGLGGIGKTHLALHYAHACAKGEKWVPHRYDAILWFYAEAGLDSQFYALAKGWGNACKTSQEAVQFVYKDLQKKLRTLLVFDNVEESNAVDPYLPSRYQKNTIDILMTTRNPELDLPDYSKSTYITLDTFTREESRAYTQKVLGRKGPSQRDMDALWETVSGLPLALSYALQYIKKEKRKLAKYPARFAEHQLRLGTQMQASPLVTSLLLPVLTLREEHPIIEPLLVTAAHLAPKKIPITAVSTVVDTIETQQALVVLHEYGLLTLAKDYESFDIHRLVQQILREWHLARSGETGPYKLLKDWAIQFQPLLKKGRPKGGSSTDIQYFKDSKNGEIWIGKCNINAFRGANNDEEYREALGLAIYRFFGITTPDFVVSVQPVAPKVYERFPSGSMLEGYRIKANRPCIHIMSQFLKGFSTCEEAFKEDAQDEHKDDQKAVEVEDHDSPFMRAYKQAAKAKQSFYLEKNGKEYPLQGLGSMLAVANFIYDMDCIGKSGGNLGYHIDDKGHHAQVVKIDPGYAFSFLDDHTNKKLDHNPMNRKTFFGTHEQATLAYDQLTRKDQQDFAKMAGRILKTPITTLKKLIDDVVMAGGWQPQKAKKLLNHLIARKSLFLAAFALEIDDTLRKEIRKAENHMVATLAHQKGAQKQSKAQVEAYKKALKDIRTWEAKVAANHLAKKKEHKNNQAKKPLAGEIFQLPARSGLFIGRKKERASIVDFFGAKREEPCAFQAITGLGGIGKTQLALHYAHACAHSEKWVPHHYDVILWLHAETGLDSQFHALAKAWGAACETAQEAAQFVYLELQKKTRTLLVFDNAEKSEAIAQYVPPRHQKGLLDILMTTRNRAIDLAHRGQPPYITLDAFTQKEARIYAQQVLGDKGHSQQEINALWGTVSGLPLALHHALQYIKKGKCTLAEYPAHFAKHQLILSPQLQENPLVTSFLLSVLTLREDIPVIQPLLITAAYLAPDNIPTDAVFTMIEAQATQQVKKEVLGLLQTYGILTLAKDGHTFDFHRLVQQVLRQWYISQTGQKGHNDMLKDWMAYFKKNLAYEESEPDAISRIKPLIPHAYAIADAISTSASVEKAQAELYCQVGDHLCFGMLYYDRAKQCYEKALAIQEQHYGETHPSTASTLESLVHVLRNLGDYAAAKKYVKKELKINAQRYGATMVNLGVVLAELGDYASAKTHVEEALAMQKQHYGNNHPVTALTMENLHNVLIYLADYAKAKKYLEEALNITAPHHGDNQPSTAIAKQNLETVLTYDVTKPVDWRCKSIKSCKALSTIIECLEYWQKINNDIGQLAKIAQEIHARNNYRGIIGAYHHILDVHLNGPNNKEVFRFINDKIKQHITCTFEKCKGYDRNQRDQENELRDKDELDKYGKDLMFIRDRLDTIHAYLVHGSDSGHRYVKTIKQLKIYNRPKDDSDYVKSDADDEKDEAITSKYTSVDQEVAELKEWKSTIKNKGKNQNKNKFNTSIDAIKQNDGKISFDLLESHFSNNQTFTNWLKYIKDSECDTDCLLQEIAMDKKQAVIPIDKSLFNSIKKYIQEKAADHKKIGSYGFGVRLYYWDRYKNNTDIDNDYNPPYRYCDLYVKPHYPSFKHEILDKNITISKWEQKMYAAKLMLSKSSILSKLKAGGLYQDYGIAKGDILKDWHVLAIIFYTDFTALSTDFSESFRYLSSAEKIHHIVNRNAKWYYLAKYLREVVECFGTRIDGKVYDEKNTAYKQTKKISGDAYYHGVSYLLFTAFSVNWYGPLSTSKQMEVATLFTTSANNGLLLELKEDNKYLRFFNVSLVSSFSSEDERLFIGGYHPIQIASIRLLDGNQNLQKIMHALFIVNSIIRGKEPNNKNNASELDSTIFLDLYVSPDKFSTYPKKIWRGFRHHQQRIKIDMYYMYQYYKTFIPQLCSSVPKHKNLLLFNKLINIFPNVTEIICQRTDYAGANVGYSSDIIDSNFIEGLEAFFSEMDKNAKLKQIIIQTREYEVKHDSKLYAIQFDTPGWQVGKGNNTIVITKQHYDLRAKEVIAKFSAMIQAKKSSYEVTSLDERILKQLMANENVPAAVQGKWKAFTHKQREVKINIRHMYKYCRLFAKHLSDKKCKNLLLFDKLANIFPNVTKIICENTDWDEDKPGQWGIKGCSSADIISSKFIASLKKRFQNIDKSTRLKKVIIRTNEQEVADKCRLYTAGFKKLGWKITKEDNDDEFSVHSPQPSGFLHTPQPSGLGWQRTQDDNDSFNPSSSQLSDLAPQVTKDDTWGNWTTTITLQRL